MGVYPIMYALLDIERAGAGLSEVAGLQVWDDLAHGNTFWWGTVHELNLASESPAFVDRVAWVNAGPPEEVADWENPERVLAFSLGSPTVPWRWGARTLTLGITLEGQLPLPKHLRERHVLASIGFHGEKWGGILPSGHPVHSVITALLSATQPVYAWTMGDSIWPGDRAYAELFRRPWETDHHYSSMYYGPELLPFIPPILLTSEGGLGHVERLRGGYWATLPGWSTVSREVPEALLSPHHAALAAINAKLREMPSEVLWPTET